jgi:hypothetical protein
MNYKSGLPDKYYSRVVMFLVSAGGVGELLFEAILYGQ